MFYLSFGIRKRKEVRVRVETSGDEMNFVIKKGMREYEEFRLCLYRRLLRSLVSPESSIYILKLNYQYSY